MHTRKLVVSAAVAGVSVLGFASAVSANVLDSATDATSIVDGTSDLMGVDADTDADTNAETNADANADTGDVTDLGSILPVDNIDNASDVMKTCEQTSSQSNTSSDSDNS